MCIQGAVEVCSIKTYASDSESPRRDNGEACGCLFWFNLDL